MKFLDKQQREQIGFSFVMDKLGITTTYGLQEKKNIVPFKDSEIDKLNHELNSLESIINSMVSHKEEYNAIGRIFCKLKDVRNSIKRCSEDKILDEVELYEIKYFSMLSAELKNVLEDLDLNIEDIYLESLQGIIYTLDPQGSGIPTFYVYDEYSKTLKSIREKKRQKEKEIFTAKNDEEISELKQQRLDLVIEEEAVELRIRKELTLDISKDTKALNQNIKAIGRLDFLIAKANLAIAYGGTRPKICNEMKIHLDSAFSPEIKEILEKDKKRFTPVSIDLFAGTTIITGANMGGKSVTLKTIVLNLLLGQMGFFVFAKDAQFSILGFIHFVSDDMQSVSKGLSTFGAEIIKLKEVVECAKREDGFIALDEFARGTNPKEGYFLVKSLARYLTKFNSASLISTHYDGVVEGSMEHYQVMGLKNVDFDDLKYKINDNKTHSVELIQEHMEYKLEKVSKENKVPKDALNIALLLGLQKEIVDIAKGFYNEED
ncbi:MAG: MutS-related protein [Clostridium sp.]|uniref:lysine 5,6-aminomutase reactivase ATPase KamC n=1 Tax=Clostridium sp. TaxID=1506 RepID=UPI003D6C973B